MAASDRTILGSPSARFAPRLRRLSLEAREIERPGRVATVLAPAGWTSARIEAWLDWAADLPEDLPAGARPMDDDPVLDGALTRWAGRLSAWGLAMGALEPDEAPSFVEELRATVALGLAAPGPVRADGCRVHPIAGDHLEQAATAETIVLGEPDAPARVLALAGRLQAERVGHEAATRLSRRLVDVAEAVRRCEGPADACADPARNPALSRAAHAAREAGASDKALTAAIAGRAPAPAEPAPGRAAASTAVLLGERELIASGDAEMAALALLAGETVVLVFEPEDAAAMADFSGAARAGLNLEALAEPEDLEAAARLWTVALEIETAAGFSATPIQARARFERRRALIAPAGLATRRLRTGSETAGEAALALIAATAATVSAGLAARLGAAPDTGPGQASMAALTGRAKAARDINYPAAARAAVLLGEARADWPTRPA